MRKLLLLLIASVFVPAIHAQLPSNDCLDNCGAYSGDCTQCHRVTGPVSTVGPNPNGWYCLGCDAREGGESASAIKPQVPMRNDPVKSLWAWVQTLEGKQDPKYARITSMTPERHVLLMQRAVRLKLDGPALGVCSHAFESGTLAKLPAEIWQTQIKLAEYHALNFTPIKPAKENPIPTYDPPGDPCICYSGFDNWLCSVGLQPDCPRSGGNVQPSPKSVIAAARYYTPMKPRVGKVSLLDCPADCACPGNDQDPRCQPTPDTDPCHTYPNDLPCLITGRRGDN